jgi:hypothetical protein
MCEMKHGEILRVQFNRKVKIYKKKSSKNFLL